MKVDVDVFAGWVHTMMKVMGEAWGVRCLIENGGEDPVGMMVVGNDILGRLAELKRSGQEVI